MTYIKKLTMYGFKSFVKKTELPFSTGINMIIGPNGSGKSNISDALCFVLGRLSIKSMRAAKAKNLIFLGSKTTSPSKEASVEIIFDNKNKTFPIDEKELIIKRIVKKNGQSTYKINQKTKTRQEVLEILSYAGIYPDSFNIILQGKIQYFISMHPEERRKILEDVSGVSIYEIRKYKSLKELEKVEEKLKEVSAILKERSSYLRNLERDRKQALKFKKIESSIKVYKASIINEKLLKKENEKKEINEKISNLKEKIDKAKKNILTIESKIKVLNSKINSIDTSIKSSTGLEQEKINQEIANLRAIIVGAQVKIEEKEKRILEIENKIKKFKESIEERISQIKNFQKKSPTRKEKEKELEIKKNELKKLEREEKEFYDLSSRLKSIEEKIKDKETLKENYVSEQNYLINETEKLYRELIYKSSSKKDIENLEKYLTEKENLLKTLDKEANELEKISYSSEEEIKKQKEIIEKISKFDICPLCKSKITKEHINSIKKDIDPKINYLEEKINKTDKRLSNINTRKRILKEQIQDITLQLENKKNDLTVLSKIKDKKEQIKKIQEKADSLQNEIISLRTQEKNLKEKLNKIKDVRSDYEFLKLKVDELSITIKKDLNFELLSKQSDIDRDKISLNQIKRERESLISETKKLKERLKEKQESLSQKRIQEKKLIEEFNQLLSKKETLQKEIREKENLIYNEKSQTTNLELSVNNSKIEMARIDAKIESLRYELNEFNEVKIIKKDIPFLEERLKKLEEIFSKIGSVNLRSIDIYDSIKKEYDSIKGKVDTILNEKQGILKVIKEVDIKKKKKFIKTINELNNIFSKNFSNLSSKGKVSLDIENKKEPFNGGVNIILKTKQGKYFDITSLSGGEQTLVALSLIFSIQELNPYYFYIFDEIDAALDKQNTERLSELLKKYIKKGQYIIITHNDQLIQNANNIYGVTMHDGISKVISLKLK